MVAATTIAVIVAAALACGLGVLAAKRFAIGMLEDMHLRAVTAHADALVTGDYAKAYTHLCSGTRAGTTKAEFIEIHSRYQGERSYEILDIDLQSASRAVVTIRLIGDNGWEDVRQWPTSFEDGRVCQLD